MIPTNEELDRNAIPWIGDSTTTQGPVQNNWVRVYVKLHSGTWFGPREAGTLAWSCWGRGTDIRAYVLEETLYASDREPNSQVQYNLLRAAHLLREAAFTREEGRRLAASLEKLAAEQRLLTMTDAQTKIDELEADNAALRRRIGAAYEC